MKNYEGKTKKYEGKMKKYEGNMTKYIGRRTLKNSEPSSRRGESYTDADTIPEMAPSTEGKVGLPPIGFSLDMCPEA